MSSGRENIFPPLSVGPVEEAKFEGLRIGTLI